MPMFFPCQIALLLFFFPHRFYSPITFGIPRNLLEMQTMPHPTAAGSGSLEAGLTVMYAMVGESLA